MGTYAIPDGRDENLETTHVVGRLPAGAAAVVTLLAALVAGIATGALAGPQVTTTITTWWSCPVGDSWWSCSLPSYDLLGPNLWTGIAVFLFVVTAAAAIALVGAMIGRLSATPDGIGHARLSPVLTAAVVLFAALAAGIAAAVLLGSTTSILLTRSCPIGNPPPPCPPPPPWIEHDPNLWAGLLAFTLVLTVGTGLAAIRRRR